MYSAPIIRWSFGYIVFSFELSDDREYRDGHRDCTEQHESAGEQHSTNGQRSNIAISHRRNRLNRPVHPHWNCGEPGTICPAILQVVDQTSR